MAERTDGTQNEQKEERRRLILEALQEDHDRGAARLIRDRERQRTTEAEKSARLRELRLAKAAAEARAAETGNGSGGPLKEKPRR